MTSWPWIVRHAPSNERNPWLHWRGLLIARVVLFDDVIQVGTGSTSAPPPQFLLPLSSATTFGYDGLSSTLITRGHGM